MEIDDLIDAAIVLSWQYSDQFMPFARALRRVKEAAPWHFELVVRGRHISLGKAFYLLEVEERFSGLGVSDERLHDIGWTKLQVVAKQVTKGNVEDALRLAEFTPVHKLKILVKGMIPAKKQHCVLMYLELNQYELLAKYPGPVRGGA